MMCLKHTSPGASAPLTRGLHSISFSARDCCQPRCSVPVFAVGAPTFYIPNCWKHFYIQFLLETGPKQETAIPKSTELSPDTHLFQFDTWKVKFKLKKL